MVGQKSFGENIGVVVNSALLSVVYFAGVGVTSIVAKIGGKKFLEKDLDESGKSYWSDLSLGKKQIREYYRQF
ncbi:hypothetical protein COU62_04040 [Candidatus Pacearchaeota archaeon CG10_big_fil_rev_8_21_14_0_10_35_219]|nr:hypothetical protein [Candidatus Pacearchaeota archaeon]OIO42252.1 MAG: hypothetical protein AUJ63_03150 [Candidatus Pacearchaeota archaeon CG1_02_35_32]PIO07517.1 MAG: hypothetical protein COU62_04040 [Candidatus Pacearchaeota archaeon CG10_big_fil_rev_8_21_14_0_10_35_219]PIY81324.1 MAG: hypothetical protein COY79_03535 [Candidatus Pacearchaeota archaeon CG_4_10_14_0_8_um_filter_35_169]PIZ80253.1 MAG: hypothetical protein COY00_02175 [Candidatus Pacearchaeota archaeon CG_4_10_14_0_2_um_filt